jgi:PAS domain S-box-containing protein
MDPQSNYGIPAKVQSDSKDQITIAASNQSVAFLKTILRAAPIGIGLVRDRVFQWVNDEMLRMVGYSEDELIGQSSRILFESLEEFKRVGNAKYGQFRTKGSGETDSVYIRKDGSPIDVHLKSTPLDPSDLSKGVIFTAMDITQRKLAEKEKANLEVQLYQAQKMEAIGTLAGGIAHDFNNLLMGIQGRASLALMDMDIEDPNYEHLEGIEEYVRSAANLARQLLAFARGGKYEVKPCDLNNLVRHSARLFGRTKKEIIIHDNFQDDLWPVEVDRMQIEQVLLNLFVNAWQAMPQGGELTLETRNEILDDAFVKPYLLKPGRFVKMSVTDTGIGMDTDTLPKIFDPFFTTKELERGTGLGLASTYGIIKNHDGLITVTSQKGTGTTFYIYLPASTKTLDKKKQPPEGLLMGKGTVLLVDDEDMILEVGKPMLNKMGYDVQTARRGEEALDFYRQHKDRINVVILDMIMPGMSGSILFDRLQAINPNVKVLLSSGYSLDGRARDIMNRGCHGFIQKPFNAIGLSKKLHGILSES